MDKELRILILEDVPIDAELEERELRKAGLVFTSKVVDTREAFLKALNEFFPDLILSDYELPAFDGLAALRIAKEKCPDLPFILVTGKLGEEFAIEKLKEGATDYVLKSNLKRLVPSVNRALEEAKEITKRKQAEEKIRLRTEELSGLHMLSKEITTKLSTERFVRATLDGILKVLHPDLVYFFLRDGEKLNLIGIAPEIARPGFEIPEHRVGECMCGLAITTGKALYSSDISKDVRCTWEECKKAGFFSFAALPLWADSEIVGLIGLASKNERDYESEAEYIETVAHQISAGFQNALLYKRLTEHTRQLEMEVIERKKTEEEIKMLSSVVKQSTEGMAIADLDGKIIFVNEAWCKMHGYNRPEEILGKNLAISHNQEQMENEVKPFNERVIDLGSYSGEVGHITKDGKPFPTLMTSTLLKDKQGKPHALVGIAKDITERKRAELQIRESEKRYRELYEGSRDGYAMVNMEGTIIESNTSFKEMLGYTDEELLIKTYEDITPLKWHPIEAKILEEQVMKRGYSDIYEKEYIRKNGTVFPIEIRTCLLKGEYGKPKAMWAFVSDITERKHAEKEIQRRVKELEDFYEMAVGRELRMKELKKQMEEMKEKMERLNNELGKYKRP